MKKSLLLILLVILTLSLQAQKDTTYISPNSQRDISRAASNIYVSIYPVPVRDNLFTIKTDRGVSFVKITNIIGQDIYKVKYNDPLQLNKISLDNPKRGMYLVTIIFNDGVRVVKKIMVEESD
jgi:hypothetical protein